MKEELEDAMDAYERRQAEIDEILQGRRPGPPRGFFIVIGIWVVSLGVWAWLMTRWLW
jgi:hypothetical protein